MRHFFLFLVFALAGCASSSVMQYNADTIQITTSAAPVCGSAGAQKVAYQRAAIETINHGFDRFVVAGADAEDNVRVVGTTPMQATTYGTATGHVYGNTLYASGQSNTYFTGGQPIIAGSHDQALIVRMFKDGDPSGLNALSARAILGPDWETLIKKPPVTC